METRHISVLQGTTAAPVQEPAEDYRLNGSGLWTPDPAGGRNVRSGILPGPLASDGNSPLAVIATPATAGSVTIKAGHFVVQGKTALSGSYVGTVDADKTRTISPLPTSGGYKAGRVLLHVYDQAYGDAQDGWDIEILLGAQAASSAAAVLPAIPVSGTYFELREFTVDSAGNLSFTGPLPVLTVPRGGILPVQATETTSGSYDGQYRDHPTYGAQRWSVARGQWENKPMILGKMWRTGGFSGSMTGVTGAVNYTVQFDTARLAGGFTFTKGPSALSTTAADTYLTVPLDGLYTVRGRGYLSGGSGLNVGLTVYVNSGAGAGVLSQGAIYKPDGNDRMCALVDTVPLKAGDRLWLALSPNATGTQYWGSGEGQGVMLSAYYEGPLNGATPL